MRWMLMMVIIVGVAVMAMYIFDTNRREVSALAHRDTILRALSLAKEVRMVEHSDRYDEEFAHVHPFVETIYKSVVLTPDQVARLAAALPDVPDYVQSTSECGFSPHHRLEITRPNGSQLIVEFCFKCNEFKLDGENYKGFPREWRQPLQALLQELGINPNRGVPDFRLTPPPSP